MMKNTKKIVCYMGTLGSGGAEHQMCILTKLLADRGYDVTIPTYRDGTDFYEVDPRVKRVHIANGKCGLVKVFALMWHALTVRADVVISWGFFQSVFILFALLFRPSIKVICGERECTKLTPSIYEKLLYAGLYKRAAYIVPNSYVQRDFEATQHPEYASKIITIINYTDVEYYKPIVKSSDDVVRVGIICRVEEQKNMWNMIEALNIIKHLTTKSFEVYWYGKNNYTNPEQVLYLEKGYNKVKEYNLENILHFKGPTNAVLEAISSCDVMCLASFYEGFSNSLSEYISCGKPVLCSNIDENAIMVTDGENGYTFDPYDVNSIVNAFIKFFTLDEEQIARMGRRSREYAEMLFNKERFVNSYIQLIEG